ncbi:hypothetical protein [Streptomyces sp. NPDC046685]|uniref:hypothetical protein n=1 Tax=Streptomyces sp. NPDC046685 TaxID=3157202 RepID=UPI0033E11DDC
MNRRAVGLLAAVVAALTVAAAPAATASGSAPVAGAEPLTSPSDPLYRYDGSRQQAAGRCPSTGPATC